MEMRTRVFNKMTAQEVEDYLARGGRTIFVGVGVVEVHGASPIDVETIVPEAYALAMAEEADGLCMINLPYMFPGGTIVSNATVQVTVRQSIDFLMMIGRSLVAQGFDKIFFVSGHGPASLYIDAMCRDFFQETKIHCCHLHPNMPDFSGPIDFKNMPKRYDEYGAYKMLGQMDYLPIDPNAVEKYSFSSGTDPEQAELTAALRPFGGKTSIYYSNPNQHGGGRAFHSEEERLEACEKGEKEIRDWAKKNASALERLKKAIDAYHVHVQQIMKEHPRLAGQY